MPREIIFDLGIAPQDRYDPLSDRWVTVSAQRNLKERKEQKPMAAYSSDSPDFLAACPFCPGNEEETPEELVRILQPSDPQKWLVRGCPNLYPIRMIEKREVANSSGFFKELVIPAIGAHEILIETSKHNGCLSCLSEIEIAAIFEAMIQRYWDLKKDTRFRYFYAFKNYGPGASQDHPHWQLETYDRAPQRIYERYKIMHEYKVKNGECLLCRFWRQEKGDGRMVLETDHFIAYVPFAPSEPYEIRIAPKEHYSCFAFCLQNREISLEFASVIKEAAVKVKKVLQGEDWQTFSDPPHLFCLFTAPYTDEDGPYHWHLEFLPRTTQKVGHEIGTGEDVIPIFPEETAATLRAA